MKIPDRNQSKLMQLKGDCSKCSGLCCIALFFSKLDGFPENKQAGKPCSMLQQDYRCKIHSELELRTLKGCLGYDCFGAGQHVTQFVYGNASWKTMPNRSREIFDVFVSMFQLYQIRYYLEESAIIVPTSELRNEIDLLIAENKVHCNSQQEHILSLNIDNYRVRVNNTLREVVKTITENVAKNPVKNEEYIGKSYIKRDMSGYDLSGKLLIAADFDSCIFNRTIFLGADTRDTNFSNADLTEAVFLTQVQINHALGNRKTKLPKHLDYPVIWR